jgi:DNA-binding response OmpR family regulator
MLILLIEDNERLILALAQGLREEGIDVVSAGEGGTALARAARGDIDLVVLDLGLPDRDGMDVLCELRRGQPHVPVLVLTARDAVEARVQALDLGADDYLLKPFAFAELLARIRALSRRAAGPRWSPRIDGVVTFDGENAVQFADQRVPLSPREHALLGYLLRRRGEVVPRGDILREVFGCVADPGTNAIDVHLAHLRRKLAGSALNLETVRGVGIRVTVDER